MPGLSEALKFEQVFRMPATTIFTRLAQTALRDLVHQATRLNERFVKSGRLQPRVEYKAGRLAEVLASLRNQEVGATGRSPWSITAVEESES